MLAWMRFALFNLFRNRRRSLYAIIIVAVGFAGINIFGGFTKYIFSNLRESYIYTMGSGHLQIAKQRETLIPDTSSNPLDTLLSPEDISMIRKAIMEIGDTIMIYQTMYLSGLISNGDISTIFVSLAAVPSEFYAVQGKASGMLSRLEYFDGEKLNDDFSGGIGIGRGLANKLNRKLGATVSLLVPTVQGHINTMDAKIVQFSDTTQELLDDKLVLMPMSLAQALYMFEGAGRVHVLLNDEDDIEEFQQRLASRLRDLGMEATVFTWKEISPFYTKVERMFQVIFFFIFLVVSSIVMISIINTLTMAILERTREIGTMRALGANRPNILLLFSLESGILGVFGCVLGLIIWGIVMVVFNHLSPVWTPPQISRSIPLEIHADPFYLFLTAMILILLSFLSGLLPARRIAFQEISEALRHV